MVFEFTPIEAELLEEWPREQRSELRRYAGEVVEGSRRLDIHWARLLVPGAAQSETSPAFQGVNRLTHVLLRDCLSSAEHTAPASTSPHPREGTRAGNRATKSLAREFDTLEELLQVPVLSWVAIHGLISSKGRPSSSLEDLVKKYKTGFLKPSRDYWIEKARNT